MFILLQNILFFINYVWIYDLKFFSTVNLVFDFMVTTAKTLQITSYSHGTENQNKQNYNGTEK